MPYTPSSSRARRVKMCLGTLKIAALIAFAATASSGQSAANWQTFDGPQFAFKYPSNWRVTAQAEQIVQVGPPDGPPIFRVGLTSSLGGDIERFVTSEKAYFEQYAAENGLQVSVQTGSGFRGGLSVTVDLWNTTQALTITENVVGVGKGPLYVIEMVSIPSRNFDDHEMYLAPIAENLSIKLPGSAIEGTWRRVFRSYQADLSLRADGTYSYLVRQSNNPAWELQVEGRYTIGVRAASAFSNVLAVLNLNPMQYRFSPSTIPGSSEALELTRLISEGFPATVAEPYDLLCVERGNLLLKPRQPGITSWAPVQTTLPQPAIHVVSAATSREGAAAPGALISLYASFGARESAASSLPLPLRLSDVSVTVGGKTAPLHYVGPSQINLQVPFDVALGATTVMVTSNGQTLSGTTTIAPTAPGMFLTGEGRAIAANQNYTPNSPANPARAGSYLTVYLTGQGAFRTAVASGAAAPADPLAYTQAVTTATIGGRPAEVAFSGGAPGFAGVAQANIKVPAGLTAGNQPLVITIGGVSSVPATVSVAP
jgi:uncharacterized protein (TIGR03437 family)